MRALIGKVLTVSFAAVFLSGCFRITYITTAQTGDTYRTNHWNHYFVAGLIPVQEKYTVEELCPSKELVEVRSLQTPANVIASLLGLLNNASTLEAVCLRSTPAAAPPPAAPTEKTLSERFFR